MEEKIEYDYSKLKGKIVEKYGNIKKFSKSIGISATTLYKKLSNRGFLNQIQIDLIAKALFIPITEINDYFFHKKVKKNFTKRSESNETFN